MTEIDKNTPLPPSGTKYPFADMDIGDSFLCNDRSCVQIASAAYKWAKAKGNGAKFTCRTVEGGVRCWRVK